MLPIRDKYRNAKTLWYRRFLHSKVYEIPLNEPKPKIDKTTSKSEKKGKKSGHDSSSSDDVGKKIKKGTKKVGRFFKDLFD